MLWSVVLYGSQTWATRKEDIKRLGNMNVEENEKNQLN